MIDPVRAPLLDYVRRFRLNPPAVPFAPQGDGLPPRHGPPPRARLWDLHGNEYLGLLNGLGPILLGHAPPFVTQAMASQPFRRSL
jgi:glutamate-1-semialdehyde aminotransferase